MLKDLIEYVAKSLVDNPDAVQVSEIEGEQTSVIELKVAKEDLGKVIGKQGRTARAMPFRWRMPPGPAVCTSRDKKPPPVTTWTWRGRPPPRESGFPHS